MEGCNIAILGDGDIYKNAITMEVLEQSDAIICCDAAILKLLSLYEINEIEKFRQRIYIVGDMDTLPLDSQRQFSKYITKFTDQETNDQTKAFNFALNLNPSNICFLGISGRREDHTLGNISLLVDYKEACTKLSRQIDIKAVTNFGTFYPVLDSVDFKCVSGTQVSIFTFDNTVKIKSEGLAYPTDNVIFDVWWKATLNEVCDNSFKLEFSHPAKALIYIAFK